jgi:hypothetical protein
VRQGLIGDEGDQGVGLTEGRQWQWHCSQIQQGRRSSSEPLRTGGRGRGRYGLRKPQQEKIDAEEKGGDDGAWCFLKRPRRYGTRGVCLGGATWRRGRGASMMRHEEGRGGPAGGRTRARWCRVERHAGGIWIGKMGAYDAWAPA